MQSIAIPLTSNPMIYFFIMASRALHYSHLEKNPVFFSKPVLLSTLPLSYFTALYSTVLLVYALVFNLSIAFKKLRVFHYCGISPPSVEFLVLHLAGWRAQSVPIRTSGTFRSLGVDYAINPSDATSFESSYQRLRTSLRILARKRASPGLIMQVMTTCLLSRGAYVGVLSSWSRAQCRSLDKLFARAYLCTY